MNKTLSDLLNTYKIAHSIPSNDPFINLPLSLFEPHEYIELIIILWFYDNRWIDLSKLPKPGQLMGDFSKSKCDEFYLDVSSKIMMTMQLSNTQGDAESGLNHIYCTAPAWHVNSAQVTFYLGSTALFKKLLHGMQRQLAESTNPRTVATTLRSLGIAIPEKMSTDVMYVLKETINSIPNISEDELSELIFYLVLFVSNFAIPRSSIAHFTYCGAEELFKLKSLTAQFSGCIKEHLSNDPATTDNSSSIIAVDQVASRIKEISLTIHPQLLALLCFQSSDHLKQLFRQIWEKQGIELSTKPAQAISPCNNRFAVGYTLYNPSSKQLILTTNNELNHILKLMQIADNYNSYSTRGDLSLFAASVPLYLDRLKEEFDDICSKLFIKELQHLLTIANINNIKKIFVTDFLAVHQFVLQYKVDSKINCPPTADLKELRELLASNNEHDAVWRDFIEKHLFLNYESSLSFEDQSIILDLHISQIGLALDTKPKDLTDEDFELRLWWFEMQLNAINKYKESLDLFIKECTPFRY